ncbi:AAA family ATPase [Streptomyces sp. SID13031]|uniref:AAA family ATPase n=1 Tax=Streptomyces sp. SID13031 TaxID=2706046 RepID=UPI0013CA06BC|nr:AAA family ATPase [Streptomyces sp. SID13031]NEA30206.1 AAA family ATPase [Streptomyces sp. SID13031]
MTLEEELAAWLLKRPAWQQDVVGRMCRNEVLGEVDIKKIVDDLIASAQAVVTPVTAADIPGSPVAPAGVRLAWVTNVRGVNDLAEGQTLTFGEHGLTVVYGFNGSGKSGYARLLRRGVSARVGIEVLGNVFGTGTQPPQEASIDYADLNGKSGTWTWGSTASGSLAQVRFYDRDCGQAYVTVASEISYRPSALVLLEWLVAICDKVAAELDARLIANNNERASLPPMPAGTSAAAFLGSLSAQTADAEIVAATTVPTGFSERVALLVREFARLEASDLRAEKERLRTIAKSYETVSGKCRELGDLIGAAGLEGFANASGRARSLREAAVAASLRGFETEPLAGVGSAAWRELWQAARRYSETDAYPDRRFPVADAEENCVLCQQTLLTDGADRLRRFYEFMVDTTEQQASAAEAELEELRKRLLSAREMSAEVHAALERIQPAGLELAEGVRQWLAAAAGRGDRLLAWMGDPDWGLFEAVQAPPTAKLDKAAAAAVEQAESIDQVSYTAELDRLRAEITEARSTRALVDSVAAMRTEVSRLKVRTEMQSARDGIETSSITREATELTKKHVTQLVSDQFVTEAKRLGLRRVTFAPAGGRKGVLTHKPGFVGATRQAPVQKVLSEGELTALGLAGFLTEVKFEGTKSAVVFDDPVTSLDHHIREEVALRLVELAAERQVIVFTHDITFVIALERIAETHGLPTTDRTISRRGDQPGICTEIHHWTVQDVKTRIQTLDAELLAIKRDRPGLTEPEYEERVAAFAGKLSETWERMVNLEVISRVLDAGSGEVRPKMFKVLAKVTPEDDAEFQSCYGQTSTWARRHDNNPGSIYVPPEPNVLEDSLKVLKAWRTRIRGYQN